MRFVILGILCGLLFGMDPCFKVAAAEQSVDAEVRRDFETVLDLWRDGRYEELYSRTYSTGKQTKEGFVRRLSASGVRPACCWEKLQDAKVCDFDDRQAVLHARVGLETGGTETGHCTRSFRLRREEGIWKASAADLLDLAGNSGGKKRRK